MVLDLVLPAGTGRGAGLLLDGAPLPPPAAAGVIGGGEAARLLHLARLPHRPAVSAAIALRAEAHGEQAFAWPEPLTAEAFAAGFPAGLRADALRFVAGAAPALRAARDGDLASLCLALAAPVARAAPLARPEAGIGFWRVPEAAGGIWRVVSPAGIRPLPPPRGGVLAVEAAMATDSIVLPPSPLQALRLESPGAAPALRAALRDALAAGREGAALPAAIAACAPRVPRLRDLLRQEMLLRPARVTRLADPAGPVAAGLDLALSDHDGGVFLCGWLRDPLGLVEGLALRGPGGDVAIPQARLHRVARPDLARDAAASPFGDGGGGPGLLCHLPGADPLGVPQWRLAMRLKGGGALEVTAPPGLLPPRLARDLVLRAAHPTAVTPDLLDGCIAPAAGALHSAALRDLRGGGEVSGFGSPAGRPRASLVVPLYRNLRFLRCQVAAFARDAATRAADIVFVLDSPEQRHEVEHLLRGMSAMLGLPMRLVVMPRNGGYAAACNAGAALARASALLFLNSDVLPASPGWLDAMLARLGRERRLAAVGPRLLFDDGSIQHAGLLFRRGDDGVWFNDHYCKGYPRRHAAAARARRVPGVTGAALLVRRAAFEQAGGFCTDYIVGDFEDSDLCLRLRESGGEIAYEPAAELIHFERQSIGLHEGHARTLAGAVNRRLHHRRWDGAIAALMARFPAA